MTALGASLTSLGGFTAARNADRIPGGGTDAAMPHEEVGHVAPKATKFTADELLDQQRRGGDEIARTVHGVAGATAVRGAVGVESDDELFAALRGALMLPGGDSLRQELKALLKPVPVSQPTATTAGRVVASGAYTPRQALADGRISASGLAAWETRFLAAPAAVGAQLRTFTPVLDGAKEVAAAARSVSVQPGVARASASSKLKHGEDGSLRYEGLPTKMVNGEPAIFTVSGFQSVSSFEKTGGSVEDAAFALELAHQVPNGPTGKLFAEGTGS